MIFTKLDQADLDSPRRELFNGGVGFVAAHTIWWQIDFFVRVHTGGPIQLYRLVCLLVVDPSRHCPMALFPCPLPVPLLEC